MKEFENDREQDTDGKRTVHSEHSELIIDATMEAPAQRRLRACYAGSEPGPVFLAIDVNVDDMDAVQSRNG